MQKIIQIFCGNTHIYPHDNIRISFVHSFPSLFVCYSSMYLYIHLCSYLLTILFIHLLYSFIYLFICFYASFHFSFCPFLKFHYTAVTGFIFCRHSCTSLVLKYPPPFRRTWFRILRCLSKYSRALQGC